MTPELHYLVWSVGLTVVQMLLALLAAVVQVGLSTLAGNRDDMPVLTGWAGRAARAHRNMLENLVLFAILVLAAKAANFSNELTILGAQLFFWGRVAYVALYLGGVAWLRTGAFLVSMAGLVLFFIQFF